jgi:hypothetical protein
MIIDCCEAIIQYNQCHMLQKSDCLKNCSGYVSVSAPHLQSMTELVQFCEVIELVDPSD